MVKKLALPLMRVLPLSVQAYGTRNWLSANQHYSGNVRHKRYVRGYNYLSGGERTIVRSEQDRINWSYEGNYRCPTAPGSHHRQRRKTK